MDTQGINVILSLGRGDRHWVEYALREIPIHRCVCITRYEDALPKLRAREYVWYEGHGLGSVNWNAVRSLDEEVIESMRDCESYCLNMLSRTESKEDMFYPERKREYLQCLRYWNHVFTEQGVDLFISNEIPHFGFSFIPYTFCKQRGIPTLFFQNMRLVPDVLFLMSDWENPVPGLAETYERLKEKHPDGDVRLPERFESYFRSQTEKAEDPTPWHMRGKGVFIPKGRAPGTTPKKLPLGPLAFLRDALLFLPRRCRPAYWRRHIVQWSRNRRRRALFRFYDAHANPPDLTRRYVYLPLHMQPECTTAPMAGAYVDQALMVQMLNAALPDDVSLYVKEHPDQGKRSFDIGCRSTEFYEDLLACGKVCLVPRTFGTFDLMEHAEAIATATGSPGFEALFRGKPVFMFGHRFFQRAPGVFPIHTAEDCEHAVRAIFEEGARPTLPELRLFLKAIDEICIPAATNPYDASASTLPDEERIRIVGDALRKKIMEAFGDGGVQKSAPTSHAAFPTIHRMLAPV